MTLQTPLCLPDYYASSCSVQRGVDTDAMIQIMKDNGFHPEVCVFLWTLWTNGLAAPSNASENKEHLPPVFPLAQVAEELVLRTEAEGRLEAERGYADSAKAYVYCFRS